MKVKFSYILGKTNYNASVNVDEDEWEDMSTSERLDYLKDEVSDSISIDPDSIEEN